MNKKADRTMTHDETALFVDATLRMLERLCNLIEMRYSSTSQPPALVVEARSLVEKAKRAGFGKGSVE